MAGSGARSRTWNFGVSLQWDGDTRGTLAASGKSPLPVAPPPEFRGPEGLWSPEELLVASVNSCVMTTFLYHAAREHITISAYESEAEGTVVYEEGTLGFKRIVIRPVVRVPSEADLEKAGPALERAERQCLVSNSLRAEVELDPRIELSMSGG